MSFLSSKTIYNKYLSEYSVCEDDLKKLKKILLGMLDDIHFICEKYSLNYIICAGTLLGAVRHQGFIPWDDDIDLIMSREECGRLESYVKKEFDDKYNVVTPYNTPKEPMQFFKIELNGSKLTEIEKCYGINHGIYIDIFPLDNVPDNNIVRLIKGTFFNVTTKIPSVCADYKYPSDLILEKAKHKKELRKYYSFRRRLGFFFSFLPIQKWKQIAGFFLVHKNNHSKYCTVGIGTKWYFGEMLRREIFTERIQLLFEGKYYYAPKHYEEYLLNLYGDYMRIPPLDEREKHIIIKLEFLKEKI